MTDPEPDFDAARHRMIAAQRWFEDFWLGERFALPSRTMTEAVFLAFQAASGDNHPLHYDAEYCRRHGMPGMLAHGYLVAIQTAAGAGIFPHMVEDSLVAFLEQSSGSCARCSRATPCTRRSRLTRSRPTAAPAWSACAALCTTRTECWCSRVATATCCGGASRPRRDATRRANCSRA